MSQKVSTTLNQHQGKIIGCRCRECQRATNHEIIADFALNGVSDSGDWAVCWVEEYQIVRCLGCETLSFRRISWNDRDSPIQTGPDEFEEYISEEIYPNPHEIRQPVFDDLQLPEDVERIYNETLSALNNGYQVLCGIGIRAIVETVCKHQNTKDKESLEKKIDALVENGVLAKNEAGILHRLRTLGNDAAHEVKPHSTKTLGLAMDVVDHLLRGTYILPLKAKESLPEPTPSNQKNEAI
jgi:hypothetical protein